MASRGLPASYLHAQTGVDNVFPNSRVTILSGHTESAFVCGWNPVHDILASTSADTTARLWDMSRRRLPSNTSDRVLTHDLDRFGNPTDNLNRVITMGWSHDGKLLATATHSGYVRLWDTGGRSKKDLFGHIHGVVVVRWNKTNTRLLTGSNDKTVSMWHVNTGILSQKFEFHSEAVTDVDWQTDNCFASASGDTKIHIFELGYFNPIHTFSEHTDDVNSVRWDPQGQLLASGSDDRTIKLWSMDSQECLHNLTDHDSWVNLVRWSPSGPGSSNPNAPLRLASVSDNRVLLWDVERGECTSVLDRHAREVHAAEFSPDARFIASCAADGSVRIWSVQAGALIETYESQAGIYDVSWNSNGTLLGACGVDGSVIVFDLRG